MSDADGRPAWTPPLGTSQRIRNRAIWAVAFFAASVPPAFVGAGMANVQSEELAVGMPIAFVLWAIGALIALAAAFSTLRYWEGLTLQTRLLGALPLLTVSFFITAALIGALLV
jgi:glutathione S-transferase